MPVLEKVTVFITRPGRQGLELLLFRHPFAGIQIPAGTVEEGEPPEQAALRETAEETGLTSVRIVKQIGVQEITQPPGEGIVLRSSKVFARPDPTSFDWAFLKRGLTVKIERQAAEYTQVSYIEYDNFLNPQHVTYQITGWIPQECLTNRIRRTFYHLEMLEDGPDRWDRYTDQHSFQLFWAPLDALPEIVSPQNEWIEFLERDWDS